jgi:hypothetical protein
MCGDRVFAITQDLFDDWVFQESSEVGAYVGLECEFGMVLNALY